MAKYEKEIPKEINAGQQSSSTSMNIQNALKGKIEKKKKKKKNSEEKK